jgi:N-acetylmuramoyl-L-alanine amidase
MDLNPEFQGLRNISMDYENSAYKYMYGETPDYDESKNLLEEKAKGTNLPFWLLLKNGNKISIQEAVK